MGSNPTIPGDIVGEPGPPLKGDQLKQLLDTLRQNAAKDPIPMTHNRNPPINYPDLSNVTHVYIKKGNCLHAIQKSNINIRLINPIT